MSNVRRHMKPPDPLERAQILARFDRTAEAIAVARQALREEPYRVDLREELLELERRQANLGGAGAAKHQLVGWTYLLASFGLVFSPVYALLHFGKAQVDALSLTGLQSVLALGAVVLALVLLLYVGLRVFLWLWFTRLARLPPPVRPLAEAALARAMALHVMEPQYSRVRERLLGEHDA